MKLKYIAFFVIFFAAANFASALDIVSPAEVKIESMSPNPAMDNLPVDESETEVFTNVDKMPEFQGGEKAMYQYLVSNFNYPENALENNIEGKVVVRFIVDKDGYVTDAKVVKSVNEDLDKEALRIVSKMPQWIPGENNDKKVNTYFVLPILFKLK